MVKGFHKKKSSIIYKRSPDCINSNQEQQHKYQSQKKKPSPVKTFNPERNRQAVKQELSSPKLA